MQNILVTGGAGFIGSNFIHYLQTHEAGLRVIDLDYLTYAGNLDNLSTLPSPESHIFIEGDICDRGLVDGLLEQYRIDTIVNFAAETHVDRSILDPAPFIHTNIQGTFILLEAARKFWIEQGCLGKVPLRFHHVSTDEVFGTLRPDDPAFSEYSPYLPNSPYAASKASADHLVISYHRTYGLPVSITRCSNNYGPYQFPEKLIPLVIMNGKEGKALPVYGDGLQIRDWLYVEDHCEAIWLVLQNGPIGTTYNIGGNNQIPNIEIIEKICALLDRTFPDSPSSPHRLLIQHIADRPGHDRRYAMDSGKIQKDLGWFPKHSIDEGIDKTIQWYIDNQKWIDAIRHRQEYQGWLRKNYSGRGGNKK